MFEFSWWFGLLLVVVLLIVISLLRRLVKALRRPAVRSDETAEWDTTISQDHRARRRIARLKRDNPSED